MLQQRYAHKLTFYKHNKVIKHTKQETQSATYFKLLEGRNAVL